MKIIEFFNGVVKRILLQCRASNSNRNIRLDERIKKLKSNPSMGRE